MQEALVCFDMMVMNDEQLHSAGAGVQRADSVDVQVDGRCGEAQWMQELHAGLAALPPGKGMELLARGLVVLVLGQCLASHAVDRGSPWPYEVCLTKLGASFDADSLCEPRAEF